MATAATNVGIRAYCQGEGANDWNSQYEYLLGYNNKITNGYNWVVVIRFTLDKPAKSVSIPVKCGKTNYTSSTKTLSYEFGPDPTVDTSKTNIVASSNAIGSFYFTAAYATSTITLGNVSAGTHYLYIYATSTDYYTIETTMVHSTTANGITYEELECVIYIDNGSGWDAYQVFIDNGTSWDLYQAYIDNGSGWDPCG